jgi:hypothetical protein
MPPPSASVDYLGLIVAKHDERVFGQTAYRDLPRAAQQSQP